MEDEEVEAVELVVVDASDVVETVVGVLELEVSTLTASTGAAAASVVADATEEVEEDEDEVVGSALVYGIPELQTDGAISIMPSLMVETGVPN